MPIVVPAPRVVDNTVWGRLSLIKRADLLKELTGSVDVLHEVRVEAMRLDRVAVELQRAIDTGWAETRVLTDFAALRLFTRLARTLGPGESASIAYLVHHGGGWLLTDDRLAHDIAKKHGLNVASSLWLLHQAVQHENITVSDCDRYLGMWTAAGERIPGHANTYSSMDTLFRSGKPVHSGGLF